MTAGLGNQAADAVLRNAAGTFGGRVTALDHSRAMLKYAPKRAPGACP